MNHQYFDCIDISEKAYWLGFIVADGCVGWNVDQGNYSLSFGLQQSDITHLQKMTVDLGGSVRIDGTGHARLQYYSKYMVTRLIEHGIKPRKSGNEKPPRAVPLNLLVDFWRGVFDGDGCVSVKRKPNKTPEYRINLIGSYDIVSSFQNWLRTFGLKMRQRINQARNQDGYVNAYLLEVTGNRQVDSILHILYGKATRVLDRKFLLYQQLHEQNLRTPRKSQSSLLPSSDIFTMRGSNRPTISTRSS